jgi:hypothetical protein
MENGIIVSRPRFTRVRETFVLNWRSLPVADFVKLRNFWKNEVFGGSVVFDWQYPNIPNDPYSGQLFHVRFIGGDIDFELSEYGYSGTLTIQEE